MNSLKSVVVATEFHDQEATGSQHQSPPQRACNRPACVREFRDGTRVLHGSDNV